MRRPRFTIAGLLVIVLMIAVALAALWEANDLWDGGLFAGVTFTLITAILLVVHRREGSRAFWLGYYLFGWAYLLDSLVPTIEFRLPTTRGLAYLGS